MIRIKLILLSKKINRYRFINIKYSQTINCQENVFWNALIHF